MAVHPGLQQAVRAHLRGMAVHHEASVELGRSQGPELRPGPSLGQPDRRSTRRHPRRHGLVLTALRPSLRKLRGIYNQTSDL